LLPDQEPDAEHDDAFVLDQDKIKLSPDTTRVLFEVNNVVGSTLLELASEVFSIFKLSELEPPPQEINTNKLTIK
jgi:hypothetical protein